MQFVVPVTIAVHALSSIFWAGTTFVIARGELALARRLSRPVQGASAVAVLSGVLLWRYTIGGEPQGTGPRVLAVGALAAIVAVVVQILAARSLKRTVPLGAEPPPGTGGQPLVLYRASAVLLAFTVVSMVISRFI